jgi:acetylornithine deacetylase/succinyl-diaminopimelate desuccinylase-like protein
MQRLFSIIPAAITLVSALVSILVSWTYFGEPARAQSRTAQEQLAVDIYKELIEINTVTATGDTARAAEAMAARLRSAGFGESDVQVFTPAPRKGNLVARLRGTGARKPILLLAHLDVVEARPEDWSVDPFKLIEKDGYFYGRGTADDKFMAAAFVANLIRYLQEGYKPDRDIIVALETDEEILDRDALGIQWLLKNHRGLIDAEFALNEGGPVGLKNGKPIRNSVQTSEKVSLTYELQVKNRGGHSSLPTKDNAIYRLAGGLVRLSNFSFPFKLNETTRAYSNAQPNSKASRLPPISGPSYPAGRIRPPYRLSDCLQTRSTTRNCARPVWPPCWRAGTPTMPCRRLRARR